MQREHYSKISVKRTRGQSIRRQRIRREDVATEMMPTMEEEWAFALLDQTVLDEYPLAAKEYALLAALEQKMMDPKAPADPASWEEMLAERDNLEDAFWAVMQREYGVERPAVRKRRGSV